MIRLLAEVVENVNTGTPLELLPIFIAGGVLVAAIILWVVMSQVSKNKNKKRKAEKKSESEKNSEE